MPEHPQYNVSVIVNPNSSTLLYGSAYTGGRGMWPVRDDHNAPCSVCYRLGRQQVVMFPARQTCYPPFTLEYSGFLLQGLDDAKRTSEYICVDKDAEIVPGFAYFQPANAWYVSFVRCISLQCPPYLFDKPLTCVVCSR